MTAKPMPRHTENDACTCDCGPEDGCSANGYHYLTCPEYVLWHGPRPTRDPLRRDLILAGAPFAYAVVSYAHTAEEALREAQAWQRQVAAAGGTGPGSALYGPTVPVAWGTPVRNRASVTGWQWSVPVQWVVATHAEARYS